MFETRTAKIGRGHDNFETLRRLHDLVLKAAKL